MKDKPLPDPIYVKIESLDHDLNGVAYFNERSYQFKYVLPGDEITFLPLGRGKRRWNKILDKSSDITNAKCKHFSICGGCRGQHIEYDKQFELKTKPIIDYYQNNWSLNLNKFPSEKIFHYRNRMDFAVFPGFVGLREEGNFRKIVDIERCEIQSEKA
ncbi:MAG: class I SAM-dependent RNA methyltransferase, partial [Leptospiraceae bacterium]|nr:class I SAM-dependent RNA methyltransferase [Leptospiraceae bacterium]